MFIRHLGRRVNIDRGLEIAIQNCVERRFDGWGTRPTEVQWDTEEEPAKFSPGSFQNALYREVRGMGAVGIGKDICPSKVRTSSIRSIVRSPKSKSLPAFVLLPSRKSRHQVSNTVRVLVPFMLSRHSEQLSTLTISAA